MQQFYNTLQRLITYGRLTYRSNRSAFQAACLQPSKMSHQLSLSSLVLLCFCCCSSVFGCRQAQVFSCDTSRWLFGLLCSVVTPNSLPLLVSLSPPAREDVLPCSRRCWATPVGIPMLQWLQVRSGEEGQDLWIRKRSSIHLAALFMTVRGG